MLGTSALFKDEAPYENIALDVDEVILAGASLN